MAVDAVLSLRVEPAGAAPLLSQTWRGPIVRDSSYDVLWLGHDDAWATPTPTRNQSQFVNRVDSLRLITRKPLLATAAERLGWTFVPPTVLSLDQASPHDEPFSWVAKGAAHRQVAVLPSLAHAPQLMADGAVLQRRVREPLLVDGRAFDVGMYVYVRRTASRLRIATFDDVLLRFASAPFANETVALAALASKAPGAR